MPLGDLGAAMANAEAALEILDKIEHASASRVREQLSQWRGKHQNAARQ
jgi:hypothetical protein